MDLLWESLSPDGLCIHCCLHVCNTWSGAGSGQCGEQWGPPALHGPGTEVFPSHQKTVLPVGTEQCAGRIMNPPSLSSPSSQAEPSVAYGKKTSTMPQLLI